MSTHIAIASTAKGEIDQIQVTTEAPGKGEVLIKTAYGSMIAFDTYVTDRGYYVQSYPATLGFSSAGVVEKVGEGVDDLKVGDRVTAFGFGEDKHRSLQQYTVQPRSVVAKIPDSLSFDQASTIPDNFVTAFYTLFNQLGLPKPSSFPATQPPPLATTPILIYGASSTAGLYAVQLLSLAGYKKIIAIASKRNHDYLRSLGATDTFDYNSSTVVEDIAAAIGGDGKALLALDCISTDSTLQLLAKIISPLGKLAILLPIKEGSSVTGGLDEEMYWDINYEKTPIPKETQVIGVRTFLYLEDEFLAKNLMPKILPELLQSEYIKPVRVRLIDQGAFKENVTIALDLLRNNKISGEKVVIKIPE